MFSIVVLRLALTLLTFGGKSLVSAESPKPTPASPREGGSDLQFFSGNATSYDGTTGNATQGQTTCGQAWNNTDYLALLSPDIFDHYPLAQANDTTPTSSTCDKIIEVNNNGTRGVLVKVVGKSASIAEKFQLLLSPTAYTAVAGSEAQQVTSIQWRFDRGRAPGPLMYAMSINQRSYDGDGGSSLSRRGGNSTTSANHNARHDGQSDDNGGQLGNSGGHIHTRRSVDNAKHDGQSGDSGGQLGNTGGHVHPQRSVDNVKSDGQSGNNGGQLGNSGSHVHTRRSVVQGIEPRDVPKHRMHRRRAPRAPIVVRRSGGESAAASRVVE